MSARTVGRKLRLAPEDLDTPEETERRRQRLARTSEVLIARQAYKDQQARFEETGNPLYAWAALRLALMNCDTPPDWVLAYLGDAAERLLSPVDGSGDCEPIEGRAPDAAGRALGFTGAKGKRSAFTNLLVEGWNYDLYVFVEWERAKGSSIAAAIRKAKEEGRSFAKSRQEKQLTDVYDAVRRENGPIEEWCGYTEEMTPR